jgi:hypothetical protein
MRTRPKRRQVGTAGLVLRFRDGTCTHTCRRCGQWQAFPRWRAALNSARTHAGEHHAADAHYNLTANGVNAVERPRTTRRRRPLRRLAAVLAVLVLAVVAFTATVAAVTSRAAPWSPAPTIGIVTTTTAAAPGPTAGVEGYRPTPAGPPATDRQGRWIPEPVPSTSTSSSAGGGR